MRLKACVRHAREGEAGGMGGFWEGACCSKGEGEGRAGQQKASICVGMQRLKFSTFSSLLPATSPLPLYCVVQFSVILNSWGGLLFVALHVVASPPPQSSISISPSLSTGLPHLSYQSLYLSVAVFPAHSRPSRTHRETPSLSLHVSRTLLVDVCFSPCHQCVP